MCLSAAVRRLLAGVVWRGVAGKDIRTERAKSDANSQLSFDPEVLLQPLFLINRHIRRSKTIETTTITTTTPRWQLLVILTTTYMQSRCVDGLNKRKK
jgi:hypothetical protein